MTPEHMTILTVDDTPANIRLLTHYLHKQGYRVITAEDGFEGFKAAIKHKPDLILLDVMMPGTDGYEVCELLKTEEETRDIPVVFLTAKAEVEDRIRGFEMGAMDYITKPFNLTEIATRVQTQLELCYLKQQNRRYSAAFDQSSSLLSMGILAQRLLQQADRELDELSKKVGSSDKDLDKTLKQVNVTTKSCRTLHNRMSSIAQATKRTPLSVLLNDAVDLVQYRLGDDLPLRFEKPDSDMLVFSHPGLSMHGLSELMIFGFTLAEETDLIEVSHGEKEENQEGSFVPIFIRTEGRIEAVVPEITEIDTVLTDLNGNDATYALTAAILALRAAGSGVDSSFKNGELLFKVFLPVAN